MMNTKLKFYSHFILLLIRVILEHEFIVIAHSQLFSG